MRTTFSAVALCLVLCVAGSFAARADRSLKQSPSSSCVPSGIGTTGSSPTRMTPAAYSQLVRDLIFGLDFIFAPVDFDRTVEIGARDFTTILTMSYVNAVSDSVFGPLTRTTSPCETEQINLQLYSADLMKAVADAFTLYHNQFIQAASSCFSTRVGEIADSTLPNVRIQRCPPVRDTSLNGRLGTARFQPRIREAFAPAYAAARSFSLGAARTCTNP